MEYTKVKVDGVDKLVITTPQPDKEEVMTLNELEANKASIVSRREAIQVKADEAVKWRADNEAWFTAEFVKLDTEEANVDALIAKAKELGVEPVAEVVVEEEVITP